MINTKETFNDEPFWKYISEGNWCSREFYDKIMAESRNEIAERIRSLADNTQYVMISKSDRYDNARELILIAMRLFDRE